MRPLSRPYWKGLAPGDREHRGCDDIRAIPKARVAEGGGGGCAAIAGHTHVYPMAQPGTSCHAINATDEAPG